MDLEGLRNALVADLRSSEFNGFLDAIWLEKGDPGNALYFAEVNRSVRWAPQQFPCAEIFATRGSRRNPDGAYHDIIYEALIYVHVIGNDEETVEDHTNRLIRGIQDFYVVRPHVLGCAAYLGDDDYSPLISQGDGRPYVKSGAQSLFVRIQRP